MKIVICSSVSFPERIREIERKLTEKGYKVVIPHAINKYDINNFEDGQRLRKLVKENPGIKQELTKRHFEEVKNADAILVVNEEKNGIPNYIGGAAFAEMMFAFYEKKKIFLLNPIPTDEKLAFFRDEIETTQPVILGGDLNLIK